MGHKYQPKKKCSTATKNAFLLHKLGWWCLDLSSLESISILRWREVVGRICRDFIVQKMWSENLSVVLVLVSKHCDHDDISRGVLGS